MRRIPLLVLAALLLAVPAAAQQRGFTLEEVEELLRNEVANDRVLLLVQRRCIHFIPDKAALARVAAAGGSAELVAGLRAPELCSTREVPRGPEPEPAPPTPDEPLREGPRVRASVALSFIQGTFQPDGSDEDNAGMGGALGLELAWGAVGLFADGGYVDVTPQQGDDYTRGGWDVGVRLFPFPRRWPVRPYVDAGATFLEISYYDDEDLETVRALRGRGWSGAVGARTRLSRTLSADVAYRRLDASFTRQEVLGESGDLASPIRGGGSRWIAGVRWGR